MYIEKKTKYDNLTVLVFSELGDRVKSIVT